MTEDVIRFCEEDLRNFSEASGDRNPLHLDKAYANGTPYGQRVVFGALGALACLGRIPRRRITRMAVEFLRPMFLDVDYRVRVVLNEQTCVAHLYDGSLPVLALSVQMAEDSQDSDGLLGDSFFERTEAVERHKNDIATGLRVSGGHACDGPSVVALRHRWGITGHSSAVAVLCLASYLIGMDLPGRSALFFGLTVDFELLQQGGKLAYEAAVRSIDKMLQLRMDLVIMCGDIRIASGMCRAFLRQTMTMEEMAPPESSALAGQVALVVGSSRGLGASIKRALQQSGAATFGISRSESGDAADPDVLNRMRERILEDHGRLDILVCNACPPVIPLRLEQNALQRIEGYINRVASLVAAPLCAFLELLNESGGCAVIISSIFVERPTREFPHYIAAKSAVEGLARVAPLQYPKMSSLIVRPEKLLTDMTNTPLGRIGARSPAELALSLAARLAQPMAKGTTEVWHSNRSVKTLGATVENSPPVRLV
jgi:NAD(P)-dependent dehydrogenase (short-subunit alcohol dehydrogenase family)